MRPVTMYFRPTASNYAVICHGNSLTVGIGSSTKWPAVMSSLTPMVATGVTAVNAGVSGQAISAAGGNGTMMATAPTAVDAALQADKTNILFAWEFVNELGLNGLSAENAKSAWISYCAARKSAAASAGKKLKIITCTIPPGKISGGYTGADDVTYNTTLVAINKWMRNNYRSFADQICDFAAAPIFAPIISAGTYTAAEFDASGLYQADGLHFLPAVYDVLGAIGAQRMRQVAL